MEFDISNSIQKFREHLEPKKNDRIIFSGKFGAGKTYFLKEFFKDKEEESETEERENEKGSKIAYLSIHLFPINYSVASNEDIFELIKFDILFNLLEKGAPIKDEDSIPHEIFLYFYMQNKAANLLTSLLGLIPKIGSHLQKGAERAIKMVEEYNEEKKEADTSESALIGQYLESIRDEKGNIYEEDLITRIIINLVESLQEAGKEVVLLVDDLDRIDPGHLFRILNVLSAHTDRFKNNENEKDNKFGFDKIILTFDLENVKNIYHHQYGPETDFDGYIDKFYTSIFHYHLTEGLMNRIGDVITHINHSEDPGKYTFEKPNTLHVVNITYLLSCLISSTELTVRNILNISNHIYNIPDYSISYKSRAHNIRYFLILVVVDFFLEIYRNIDELAASFSKIKYLESSEISASNFNALILSSIPILDIENNELHLNGQKRTLEIKSLRILIQYKLPDYLIGKDGLYAIIDFVEMDGIKYGDLNKPIPREIIPEIYKRIIPETIKVIRDKELLAKRPS